MTNVFENILSKIAIRAEKLEGDYYKDGILYCGKCNTPKETTIKFDNIQQPKIVRIACKCVSEAEERNQQQAKIDKRRESINESLRNLADIGVARMPQCTFDMCDDENAELRERMKKYAKNFDEIYDKNIGLLLFGGTGTGKTFFAECIASELLKNGRFALLTSVSDIVNAMSNYSAQIMNYVKNVDLLILDDFGTERDTSYMSENIYNVIDARYVAKRPLIVTTNLDPRAMLANNNIRIKRIGERLAESCVSIEVKGTSRRAKVAKDKLTQLKDIFGE